MSGVIPLLAKHIYMAWTETTSPSNETL